MHNSDRKPLTAEEMNQIAITQNPTPIGIRGKTVFVKDCFERVFALNNVSDQERQALIAKGVPFTPFNNRKERRDAVREEKKAQQRKLKSR